MTYYIRFSLALFFLLLLQSSCRQDIVVWPPEQEEGVGETVTTDTIRGFYLLNEGNMGSNKSTLDFYD